MGQTFLMQVHVDRAQTELAKITKEQEAMCRKLQAAMITQDITTLLAVMGDAEEMPSMKGHSKLQEVREVLDTLLQEEDALRVKLTKIQDVEFADASIEAMAHAVQTVKATPLSRRLDLPAARA